MKDFGKTLWVIGVNALLIIMSVLLCFSLNKWWLLLLALPFADCCCAFEGSLALFDAVFNHQRKTEDNVVAHTENGTNKTKTIKFKNGCYVIYTEPDEPYFTCPGSFYTKDDVLISEFGENCRYRHSWDVDEDFFCIVLANAPYTYHVDSEGRVFRNPIARLSEKLYIEMPYGGYKIYNLETNSYFKTDQDSEYSVFDGVRIKENVVEACLTEIKTTGYGTLAETKMNHVYFVFGLDGKLIGTREEEL